MIIIGIGANLNHPDHGSPRRTCGAALARLSGQPDIKILSCSRWYQSAPVYRNAAAARPGAGDQPWYVNAVFSVETTRTPLQLLSALQVIESEFGRMRSADDAPRTLDLDIIAFDNQCLDSAELCLPHPRMEERAFVVLPLCDLNAGWVHPVSGKSVSDLRRDLPRDQAIQPVPPAGGLYGTEWQAP